MIYSVRFSYARLAPFVCVSIKTPASQIGRRRRVARCQSNERIGPEQLRVRHRTALVGEHDSNRIGPVARRDARVRLTDGGNVHERLVLLARDGVCRASVDADREHALEVALTIERVVQVRLGALQIPAECHGCVLLIEEIGNGGFMQTEVDELAHGALVDECESEVLRKVQSRIPGERIRESPRPARETYHCDMSTLFQIVSIDVVDHGLGAT